jgi:2-polyprenyl-6-methoxyphenol hydroxylase-like FAD-dependent oxidoreductase
MLNIAIIGAGPAGLATALRLHQQGFAPKIYEAAPALKPLGVGVDIKSYGTKEVTEMELLEEFREISVEARESIFYTRYGQEIYAEKCGKHMGYPDEQRFVHRGYFQMMFYDAVLKRLGRDAVVPGARCKGFQQDKDGVTIYFEPGEGVPAQVRADVMIGIDGIKSVVRGQLLPESKRTHYSGITLWRGVTVMKPYKSGGSILHIGDPIAQGSLIVYPIHDNEDDHGNTLVNWVVEQNGKPESIEDWNQRVTPDEIAHKFDECKLDFLDVGTMIRNAREVYLYPLMDHDPLPRWSFGRVTLLGDAAHAMYPRGGNGVCQALVDTRVIAEKLATISDPVEAFAQYEAERRERVNRIIMANRGEGPEVVRRIVEERSGGKPFKNIEDIFPKAEADALFMEYHRMAGMARPDDKPVQESGFKEVFSEEAVRAKQGDKFVGAGGS